MRNMKDDKRMTLTFGKKDAEAGDWLYAQADKGAYIKALIREDMKRAGDPLKEAKPREDAAVYPAVQSAGRGH